jgi:hypothetical protein
MLGAEQAPEEEKRMKKVRMFLGNIRGFGTVDENVDDLQERVNFWLKQNKNVTILATAQSQEEHRVMHTITYEEAELK